MSKDPILALENVRKTYVEPNGHPLPVLDIPRYELERGQQQVVIGRSGCGKTTLLHVIAGISAADEGEITLDGAPIHRLCRNRSLNSALKNGTINGYGKKATQAAVTVGESWFS